MKNLKRLLGLMAISGFAFGFAGNVKAEADIVATSADTCKANSGKVYLQINANEYGCYSSLGVALADAEDGSVLSVLDDYALSADANITKDVTIDLGGKKISGAHTFKLFDGADLTVKNGTVALSGASLVSYDTGAKSNTITIAKDVTVEAGSLSAAIIAQNNANAKVIANLNGTYKNVANGVIATPNTTGSIVVNANATMEGTAALFTIAKNATVNIADGSYTTTAGKVVSISGGTLNITGGNLTAEADDTIYIDDSTNNGKDIVVSISNGNIKTTAAGKYSVHFVHSFDGDYSITGGNFTSGKDLPAIKIDDWDFMSKQSAIISGGTFTKAIIGDVQTGDQKFYNAAAAIKVLVSGTTTENGGSVTVGTTGTTTTPGDQTQTPGDDTPDKNVQTYDGILSYVTLAISSLGALGFATKKVLF